MTPGLALRSLRSQRWIWSFIGAAALWVAIAVSADGYGAGATLSVAFSFATFYVIVGIGEMLVISTGSGNIDLSIPSVMTLAGYLSMGVTQAQDERLALGVLTALGVGAAAGIVNIVLIRGARIPPMIATLAAGFIMLSMSIAYSKGSTAKPAPLLVEFSSARLFGLPLLAVVFIVVALVVSLVLARTVFGRSVLAIGQSERAAYLAGISVPKTTATVYLISSMLAGLAGLLLASYSGGASLDMAADFLLMALAVVVLGGTSIAG
ncbi:MAG: ABC transporter permease, partial [Dongiaceae bacterium]